VSLLDGSSATVSAEQLTQSLGQHKTRIEGFLQNTLAQLNVNEPQLLEAMKHGLLQGGKRMRPYLVYATGSLVDGNIHDLDAPAAALECIHSYSLIHDDLPAMDDDELRRGLPTVHKKYGEATAILAGDSLISLAFDILASHDYQNTSMTDVIEMCKLLSRHSGYDGMCGGQALDLSNTDTAIALPAMEQMHLLKTGALIKSAVMMASYCVGTFSDEERMHLGEFAHAIGLAFQVHDDILDVVGETAVLGKPKGSDIAANKSTYVSLLGLDGARNKAEELYQQSLQALQKLPYDTRLLRAFATYVVQRNH
jgi:farnesyl diphosphate synthase